MSGTIRVPAPGTPLVSPKTGELTLIGRQFFSGLLNRVGGSTASGQTPVTLTLTGSPYTFSVVAAGTVVIGGSGVVRVQLVRNGRFISTGSHYGAFPVLADDSIEIDYVGSPVVTWLPN